MSQSIFYFCINKLHNGSVDGKRLVLQCYFEAWYIGEFSAPLFVGRLNPDQFSDTIPC